ncbi:MAG: chemotaxis protein CheW [Bacillota bacterium]
MKEKLLTFYIGDCYFGINVTLVKEINRRVDWTAVPGAKPHIIGFFNMRGQIVTLFDLGVILGLDRGDRQTGAPCIILKAPKDPNQVGFLIDRSGDVIEVERDDFEAPPANIGSVEGEYIDSIVKLKEELLIVLNTGKIFSNHGSIEI